MRRWAGLGMLGLMVLASCYSPDKSGSLTGADTDVGAPEMETGVTEEAPPPWPEVHRLDLSACPALPPARAWHGAAWFQTEEPLKLFDRVVERGMLVAGGLDASSGIPQPQGGPAAAPLADIWLLDLTNLGATPCPWFQVGELRLSADPTRVEGRWGASLVWVDPATSGSETEFLLVGGYRVRGAEVGSTDRHLKIALRQLIDSAGAPVIGAEISRLVDHEDDDPGDPLDMPTHQHVSLESAPRCLEGPKPIRCIQRQDRCRLENGSLIVDIEELPQPPSLNVCDGPAVGAAACDAIGKDVWAWDGFALCRESSDVACREDQGSPVQRFPGFAHAAVFATAQGFQAIGGVSGCRGDDCDAWFHNDPSGAPPEEFLRGFPSPHLEVPSGEPEELLLVASSERRAFRLSPSEVLPAEDATYADPEWGGAQPGPVWGAAPVVLGRTFDPVSRAWTGAPDVVLIGGGRYTQRAPVWRHTEGTWQHRCSEGMPPTNGPFDEGCAPLNGPWSCAAVTSGWVVDDRGPRLLSDHFFEALHPQWFTDMHGLLGPYVRRIDGLQWEDVGAGVRRLSPAAVATGPDSLLVVGGGAEQEGVRGPGRTWIPTRGIYTGTRGPSGGVELASAGDLCLTNDLGTHGTRCYEAMGATAVFDAPTGKVFLLGAQHVSDPTLRQDVLWVDPAANDHLGNSAVDLRLVQTIHVEVQGGVAPDPEPLWVEQTTNLTVACKTVGEGCWLEDLDLYLQNAKQAQPISDAALELEVRATRAGGASSPSSWPVATVSHLMRSADDSWMEGDYGVEPAGPLGTRRRVRLPFVGREGDDLRLFVRYRVNLPPKAGDIDHSGPTPFILDDAGCHQVALELPALMSPPSVLDRPTQAPRPPPHHLVLEDLILSAETPLTALQHPGVHFDLSALGPGWYTVAPGDPAGANATLGIRDATVTAAPTLRHLGVMMYTNGGPGGFPGCSSPPMVGWPPPISDGGVTAYVHLERLSATERADVEAMFAAHPDLIPGVLRDLTNYMGGMLIPTVHYVLSAFPAQTRRGHHPMAGIVRTYLNPVDPVAGPVMDPDGVAETLLHEGLHLLDHAIAVEADLAIPLDGTGRNVSWTRWPVHSLIAYAANLEGPDLPGHRLETTGLTDSVNSDCMLDSKESNDYQERLVLGHLLHVGYAQQPIGTARVPYLRSTLQTFFQALRSTVQGQDTTEVIDRAWFEQQVDAHIAHATGQYSLFSTALTNTCVGVPVLTLRSVTPEIDCTGGVCAPAPTIPVVVEQVQRAFGDRFLPSFPLVPLWLGCHREGSPAALPGCAVDDQPMLVSFPAGALTQSWTVDWDDPTQAAVPIRTELRQLGALYGNRFGDWGTEHAWCGDAGTAATSALPGCQVDADGDQAFGADCDDLQTDVHPAVVEVQGSIDQDCSCYTFSGVTTLRVHRVGDNAPAGSGLQSTCRGVP